MCHRRWVSPTTPTVGPTLGDGKVGNELNGHIISQFKMMCFNSRGKYLPTTVRGTCTDMIYANFDLACIIELCKPVAVYHTDHNALMFKVPVKPTWNTPPVLSYYNRDLYSVMSNCCILAMKLPRQ